MKFQQLFSRFAGMSVLAVLVFVSGAVAQERKSTVVMPGDTRPMPVAAGNNLYCAGYVTDNPISTERKIVGAENEQEQFVYSQGNHVYINAGSSKGVKVGDMFSVVRPRGQVETRWTKKNDVGFYVQEVGAVEVVAVRSEVSVARVHTSCDMFVMGDLLQPTQQRVSPMSSYRPALERFAESSGKSKGRILFSRDGRELLGREQIVYIDLGAEDGVKSGDFLTIFRPLGKGGITPYSQKETVSARDEGFQSDEFRGGKFSNQAGRKRGDETKGRVETTATSKMGRPDDLRKVVGEMVILSVQGKTATAVIVRTAQEIHTGDWVEVQ